MVGVLCGLSMAGGGEALATDLKQHLIAAIDSPEGRADGDLSGPMAAFFQSQTRSSAPIRVQVRTLKRFAQAGCARLQATLIQEEVPTREGKQIPFAVRYELNLCRDGQPPSEGIDLDSASQGLLKEPPGRQIDQSTTGKGKAE